MKRLLLIILFIQLSWSQEESADISTQAESTDSVSVDSLAQTETIVLSEDQNPALDPSIPLTLDAGYKGFLWGSGPNDRIYTNFTQMNEIDSLSRHKSFVGRLGPDSVMVHYFFADSGFWKVEVDFHLIHASVDKHVQDFLRHEKNISEVYGPPAKIKHKDILLAKDNGYSFFWESIFILSKKKYSIGEIPIELPYRSSGSSKMKIKDIINALIYIFIISINKSKY